jgi:hypothetical protein
MSSGIKSQNNSNLNSGHEKSSSSRLLSVSARRFDYSQLGRSKVQNGEEVKI